MWPWTANRGVASHARADRIDAVTGRGGEAHGRRRGASAGPPRADARRARSGSGRGRRGASAGGRRGRDGERRPRAGQRGGGGPELHPDAQQGDEGEAAEATARGCQGGARRPHCPVHRIAPRDLLRQRAVVPCDRHGAGGGPGRTDRARGRVRRLLGSAVVAHAGRRAVARRPRAGRRGRRRRCRRRGWGCGDGLPRRCPVPNLSDLKTAL